MSSVMALTVSSATQRYHQADHRLWPISPKCLQLSPQLLMQVGVLLGSSPAPAQQQHGLAWQPEPAQQLLPPTAWCCQGLPQQLLAGAASRHECLHRCHLQHHRQQQQHANRSNV